MEGLGGTIGGQDVEKDKSIGLSCMNSCKSDLVGATDVKSGTGKKMS